ncbi:MAG: hypothetical protein JWL77_5496 [Chthonomonadaceae bacterium]|nr:hypothetical protein [Chthonomonadaceae bacterium]
MRRFPVLFVRMMAVFLVSSSCLLVSLSAQADAAGDKRRAQLAKVQRVIVVPPFFGTETLSKLDAQMAHPEKAKPEARLIEYGKQLRSLENHVREWLPQRVTARTNFQIVPQEELQTALKELNLTPQTLFQNAGMMKGKSFAAPDIAAVRTLAQRLHVDAVLLSTLDEPRQNSGTYLFDPLSGLSYDSPKVRGKIGFWLLLPDGTEVLHAYTEALHPVSKLGSRTFLLADWTETEDEVVEDFLNELTRYMPLKIPEHKPNPANSR